MMANNDPREGIHLPHVSDPPDVPPPRSLVDEMKRERRRVPPPPRGVTNEGLIEAHVKPSGPFLGIFDSEAHQNDDPSNPYIRHGSLLVPRAHEAEFEKAERYLSRDSEAMGVLYRLEHDSREHKVQAVREEACSQEQGADIIWNPHLGTMDLHGHRISPAMTLLHEEDHAIENPEEKQRLTSFKAGERWTDLEEERVITGVESRAARILGEGVRDSHENDPAPKGTYWVDSVTHRFPEGNQNNVPSCEKEYMHIYNASSNENEVTSNIRRRDGGR